MAVSNYVSGTVSAADVDAILAAIKTIRDKMPYLQALTYEEKNSMPKCGDKSQAFIKKSYELAKHYGTEFLPAKFDVKEMGKDVELMNQLSTVLLSLSKLHEEVEDTWFSAGADAYSAALAVYQYAKNSDLGTVGLDSALDELGKRFARRIKDKSEKP